MPPATRCHRLKIGFFYKKTKKNVQKKRGLSLSLSCVYVYTCVCVCVCVVCVLDTASPLA